MPRRTHARCDVLCATMALMAATAAQLTAGDDPCAFERFSGFDGGVSVLVELDAGAGPALYAGGYFESVDDQPAMGVARLDETGWTPVGHADGIEYPEVFALAVFDDGTGPALYAAGYFYTTNSMRHTVARLDGDEWQMISGDVFHIDYVQALAVYDDGSGPALYAGGSFSAIGGQPAGDIARWDGSSWNAVGDATDVGGPQDIVNALVVHDDGTGPALYAGGEFASLGGQPAHNIARWDGQAWSPLPGSAEYADGTVKALASDDDYSIKSLYVGGQSEWMGVEPNRAIARWRATGWSRLTPLSANATTPDFVQSLTLVDDGRGLPEVHAIVGFIGTHDQEILSWTGIGWKGLPVPGSASEFDSPSSVAAFDRGDGLSIYAGAGVIVARQTYDCNPVVCCGADTNQDGSLNLSDVFDFIDLFNRGEAPADVNMDRVINFLDVMIFLSAFSADSL